MSNAPLSLFGKPVSFASAYSVEESVARLRAAVKPPMSRRDFYMGGEEGASGEVSEGKVSLRHVNPPAYNSFAPFFTGRFERTEAGATILVGKFSMSGWIKAFMLFWIVFLLYLMVKNGIHSFSDPNKGWFVPLFCLGLMLVGMVGIWVAKWAASGDVPWLSKFITEALSKT